MHSTLTSKGQLTIPKYIRDRFDLKPSVRIEFSVEGDRIILKPVRSLKSLRGSIAPKQGADEQSEYEAAKKTVASRVMEETE